ncbi:MAG: TonB-dependent receptor [Bacteroides sp.]|nr:TonB-dependent receptor [Bacteroides sp.]
MKKVIRLLFWITCLASIMSCPTVQAAPLANYVVKGEVTDKSGEAIIGASVLEKGTTNGTITNTDGKFTLTVQNEKSVLEVSYIGYITQNVKVRKGENLHIILVEDSKIIDEVVVVGYQTLRKTDVVGAVASVKSKELNISAPTVGQSLVGKVAGVQISQVSGAPYKSTKIRVRGVTSINASSDPLYVIDGYPSNTDLMINPEDIESIEVLKDAASAAIYGSRAAGGVVLITTKRGKEGKAKVSYDFQYSVTQLAKKVKLLNAAQYADLHVEGHNNAYKNLMVSAGKTWDDSYFSDTNDVRAQRLGSRNSAAMIPEFLYDFTNQKVITPEYDTDWQDELYRNAPAQRHHISINGGNDKVHYEVSAAYQDQDGIILSTSQKRLNLRSNIDIQVNNRFKMGANFSNTSNWNREVQEGRFNQGPILGALIYAPIFRCYDENGQIIKGEMTSYSSGYGMQQIENPVALATETIIRRNGSRNTYNLTAQYEALKNLYFKANLGMYSYSEKYEFYRPTSLSSGAYQPGSDQAKAAANSIARTILQNDYLGEFTANYNKTWSKVHNFSGVAGYSIQRDTKDILGVKATGYEDDHITEVTGHGADPSDIGLDGTSKSNWSMISYFTRLNYNFNNKYYLTASFRGDASSMFGPENRWGYFPSVSAAWTMSNEDFYKNTFGHNSSLKLRASWGMSGNNNIGNYQYTAEMSSPSGVVFGNGTISSAMYPGGVKDNTIGWESTSQYNVGFDLSMFSNRLSISANYYMSYTKDLLFSQPVSAISGATSIMTNLPNSKIRNAGCDIQVDGRAISGKDFNLNIGGNLSINRNKVLELDGGNTIITNGAERSYKTHITMEGQPIGMFYGFKVKGMVTEADMAGLAADNAVYKANNNSFPEGYKLQGPARSLSQSVALQPGDIYFEDVDGNGVVDDNDKTIIGTPHPKFTYGLNISGNYKNIDLTASFNGSYGNKVLDGQDYYLFNMEGSGNQYVEADQRYRNASNPGNGWVYKASRGGTQSNSTRLSTFYLQDGSFFRCTNLSIGYTFSNIKQISKGLIGSLRIYASTDNLFTISKYKGYNPEVDYNNGANLTPGVDYGKYPLARAYNMGVQLTF